MSWNNNVYRGILKSASGSNAVKIPVPQLAVIMIIACKCHTYSAATRPGN